ncbi:MAG: glycosyltransferase, partial [Gammaproteobacteria bacterium]|nr:glycosyltransferase [Gammaproteobacteria bacterium]
RQTDLIKALSLLPNHVEAIFLGSGNKEELLSTAADLNVSARCHFLGNKVNPYKYVAKSNLFVMCSEVEGFPNVLLEAMIAGCLSYLPTV